MKKVNTYILGQELDINMMRVRVDNTERIAAFEKKVGEEFLRIMCKGLSKRVRDRMTKALS